MLPLARTFALFVFASTLAACGGGTVADGATSGGAGGGAGAACAADPACALDAPGPKFTFHVHNAGAAAVSLTYGCGSALPITLTTPQGERPIGAGDISFCGFSCDELYCSERSGGCSDCGPGYGDALPPGATVDVAWDRRVFVASSAPSECRFGGDTPDCSLGSRLAPIATQAGTLTVCTDAAEPGYCLPDGEILVPFTIDTTGDGGTIEVM